MPDLIFLGNLLWGGYFFHQLAYFITPPLPPWKEIDANVLDRQMPDMACLIVKTYSQASTNLTSTKA